MCAMSRARGASFRCPEPQATRQGLRGRGAEPALRTAALGPAGLDSAAPRPLGGLHAAREVGTLAADRGRKTRSQAGLAVQPTAARPQRTPAAHVPPTPGPACRSSSQGLLPKAQLSAHTHDQNEPSLLPVASPPPASSGSQLPGWDSPRLIPAMTHAPAGRGRQGGACGKSLPGLRVTAAQPSKVFHLLCVCRPAAPASLWPPEPLAHSVAQPSTPRGTAPTP